MKPAPAVGVGDGRLRPLSEQLDFAATVRVQDQVDLDALERRGLVRIEQDGRRLNARPAHPLYGEVLRAQCLRGWGALAEGRVAAAARLTGEAAGTFREMNWPLWVRNALMIRAHALALQGDVHTARAVLADLDALGIPPLEICGPEVPRARAWTEVAAGDIAAGYRHLQEAAAMAQKCGAYALESAAVHDLARLA